MAFAKNVFVNCPFDRDFYPLLRPLLFTIIYLGLKPRIALEDVDSGQSRIDKIVDLIASSKYAIHDISRIEAQKAGDLFRLNMPFELGIDVGWQSDPLIVGVTIWQVIVNPSMGTLTCTRHHGFRCIA
jgi:hypothetical protein